MIENMPPYMLIRSNGVSWYHYLHIQGGTGHGKKGLGGAHLFCVFYLAPDDREKMEGASPDLFCQLNGIPCGVGNTIEEACEDFKTKLEKQPLK